MSQLNREEHLRAELVRVSRALHTRGWVANHDGNITARLDAERVLSTPTATSKGDVSPESLIVVDQDGALLAGTRKPFSELKLHLAAYRRRADIGAVIHAHPPTATGFAAAGVSLGAPFMAEAVVSIGPEVPLLPFGLPGDPELDRALADALARADVFLLGNHGVLAVGPDPDLCLLRIELVEHLCRIALVARQLGGPRPIPEDVVAALTKKHNGLFPRELTGESGTYGSELQSWHPPGADSAQSARDIVADALKRLG